MRALFRQDQDCLLAMLEPQQLHDITGAALARAGSTNKLEGVWARLPGEVNGDCQPVVTEIGEDGASMLATIILRHSDAVEKIEANFRLQRSPYSGWNTVQTSLLYRRSTPLHS